MSKIIRTRKPSVLPYYAAALAFVVLCAVLPVYRLWALLAALGAAVLAFAGAKKICPPRVVETEVPFHTGVDDVDAMLTEMQQQLDTLHALNEALPDPQLSAAMARMEKAGRSIVETVEATPAKAKQVRRFANYYLPDAVNVLQQYAKLAKQVILINKHKIYSWHVLNLPFLQTIFSLKKMAWCIISRMETSGSWILLMERSILLSNKIIFV